MAASVTAFCVSLYELGDSYIRNFTPAQLACSYPGRTWFDRGIVAVGSSDVPVVDCNVLRNLRSAVTRLTQKGTITPGKFADFVVLSSDPRTIPAADLPSLSVDMTVIDGRVAFDA